MSDGWFVRRVRIVLALLVLMFLVLSSRLWYLQIVRGSDFSQAADGQRMREVPIRAPRGRIFDRSGRVLADNRFSYTVSIVPEGLPPELAPRIKNVLGELLGLETVEIDRALNERSNDYPYQPIRLRRDVGPDAVVSLKERSMDLAGVIVEQEWAREYPNGPVAAQTIGYLNLVDAAMLSQGDGYRPTDLAGDFGLERAWESYLRGQDGRERLEVNVRGVPVRSLDTIDPVPGNDVITTLDLELQRTAEAAMAEHFAWVRANTDYVRVHAGAVVALDPRTGALLAFASWPRFDLNRFTGGERGAYFQSLASDPYRPFEHRGIQAYPPGSTFKPITGMAALETGAVGPDEYLYADGVGPFEQKRDWTLHENLPPAGWVTIIGALARSSNDWFWDVSIAPEMGGGKGEILADWARRFGLGKETGLRFPGERSGVVPDNHWKLADRGVSWVPGDTLNVAIGQGDLLATPLQIATAYMAIANRGELYRPYLVSAVRSPEGEPVYRHEPEVVRVIEADPVHWDRIISGLRAVVQPETRGLVAHHFLGVTYDAAGKTGSAELGGSDSHAWFASFAPAHAPEIVVVVFAEHGGSGTTTAAPIARKVLDFYFERKEADIPAPLVLP